MGKRREPRLFKLTFADEPYDGLSVTLRGLTIREYTAMGSRQSSTEAEAVQALLDTIGPNIVDWNREDENGQPLPPTLDNLRDEEPALLQLIASEWTQAMAGVSGPLEPSSNGGLPSEVESMLAEIPSQSLAS